MNGEQAQLIDNYSLGKISKEDLLKEMGDGINNFNFIKEELKKAIDSHDKEIIERAILLMLFHNDEEKFLDELNILLLEPNHRSHQLITKSIQDIANPKSIPFIKKALETNFDYLAYTCSDSEVIAKWFSWVLYEIGTDEAIEVLKEFANSEDEGIREEMQYRLEKFEGF